MFPRRRHRAARETRQYRPPGLSSSWPSCRKSGKRESDPRHPPWQGGALPLSYSRAQFAAPESKKSEATQMREKGLEPSRPKAPDPKSGVSAIPPLSQKSSLIREGQRPLKSLDREMPKEHFTCPLEVSTWSKLLRKEEMPKEHFSEVLKFRQGRNFHMSCEMPKEHFTTHDEPRRHRTCDPQIKSLLLCQLS